MAIGPTSSTPVVKPPQQSPIHADPVGNGQAQPSDPEATALSPSAEASKPIGTPEPPVDHQISEAVKREVIKASIPFRQKIMELSQQIDELENYCDHHQQAIHDLKARPSRQRSSGEDSPGLMNKLSWAVKNCFVKPAAGAICAGVALGALALMFTPIGAPVLLAGGMMMHMAFPLLVGGAAAGVVGLAYLAQEKERRAEEAKHQAGQDFNAREADEPEDQEEQDGEKPQTPPVDGQNPTPQPHKQLIAQGLPVLNKLGEPYVPHEDLDLTTTLHK